MIVVGVFCCYYCYCCCCCCNVTNIIDCAQSPIFPRAPYFFMPNARPHRYFVLSPAFARHDKPRWWLHELNDRSLQKHGKIGDCKQSTNINKLIYIHSTNQPDHYSHTIQLGGTCPYYNSWGIFSGTVLQMYL